MRNALSLLPVFADAVRIFFSLSLLLGVLGPSPICMRLDRIVGMEKSAPVFPPAAWVSDQALTFAGGGMTEELCSGLK